MAYQANYDLVRKLAAVGFADSTTGEMTVPRFNVVAKTEAYAITALDPSGTLFTDAGAEAAVAFTLPAPASVPVGTEYFFLGVAATGLSVETATADTMITYNDVAADKVSFETASHMIGGLFHAVRVVGATDPQWAVNALTGHTVTLTTA